MLALKYRNLERLLQKNPVFVNWYISPFFEAPQPTLGRYQGDSLTHLVLITAFLQFQPKGHWEVRTRLGPLAQLGV